MMRGRVLALQAIVLIGSTPVGGPLLGYVSDLYGARAGIILGGLAALGAAAWGSWPHGACATGLWWPTIARSRPSKVPR